MTQNPSPANPKTYQVQRADTPWQPDNKWDRLFWKTVVPLDISTALSEEPDHFPKAKAKLKYDDNYIYVIFRVEDRYIRAVARQFHDPVCRDSCVEFFFTPNTDIKTGYFNVEINCGGTMLCRHQIVQGQGTLLRESECEQFHIHASMPKIIDPEITHPTTWTVEYRIPCEILEKYTTVIRPAPGVVWRANAYKCGDQTSHPHWLCWSPIISETPKFHLPEFFGFIKFT